MAGRDHGEVLTRFEEIFGSVVEHEVIKLILQSCDWDTTTASDTLLGMIDKNNLPPHVQSALTADSIVRSLARKHPTPQAQREAGTPHTDQPMTPDDDEEMSLADQFADTLNIQSTISDSTSNSLVNTVLPASSTSAFYDGTPTAPNLTLMEEKRDTLSAIDGESETSSPSFSPLRFNKSVNPTLRLDYTASGEWVLAPEFVPNAFNRKASDDDVKQSMWRQGMSSRLMDIVPPSNFVSQSQQSKGKAGKKEEIVNKILEGTKLLVLMRGLPGSGKTTLAKELKGPSGIVLSTDDYFCDKHGEYIYDPSKIGEAHQWNKHRAIQRLKQGKTPIIIDNTNLQAWEMKPYVQLALQYGYEVNTLDAENSWNLNSKELARRNTHGVPAKKIEEMRARYERDVKLEDIIADLQGLEVTQQSPVRKVTAKIDQANVFGNNSKGKEITTKSSPLKTTKKSVIDLNTDANLFVKINSEFNSSEKEDDIFDSDEDVVVEGYDDRIVPISICTSENEMPISLADQNVGMPESETNEPLSDDLIEFIDSAVSEEINEIPSKVDAVTEHFSSPIDLSVALRTSGLKDKKRKEHEVVHNAESSGDESDTNCNTVLESRTDVNDEIKIQTLLDEACRSIDFSKSEEEWDNLTAQITGEDFSDEKFNDLVTSFGSALKKQMKNKDCIGVPETEDNSVTSDTMSEDCAMYDFCSTMEDKTGRPLSALITKFTRNEDSIDINSINNAGEPNMEEKWSILSHNNQSQTNNFPRNLVNEKEEKAINIPISSTTENSKINNVQQNYHEMKSPTNKNKEDEDKTKQDTEREKTTTNCHMLDELGQPPPLDTTSMQSDSENLISWECVDVNSGLSSANWDSKSDKTESDKNIHIPKSNRSQRKRMSGDPTKWLKEADTQNESIDDGAPSWEAVEDGTPEWDTPEPSSSRQVVTLSKRHTPAEPQSHTGAISKLKKHKRTDNLSPVKGGNCRKDDVDVMQTNDGKTVVPYEETQTVFKSSETQTMTIDFDALELAHNPSSTKELKMKTLIARPHYIPVTTIDSSFSEKGPLTKGGLRLDKGTMTENLYEGLIASSFQTLVAFFPNIHKEDLRDVYEKCNHDSDWAMNVLLDSGYEMSDPSDVTEKDVPDVDVDFDTDSVSETTNTDDGKNDNSSDPYDVLCDSFQDERTRKIKQSQLPQDIAKKIEIEKSFGFSESVDERVLRLTGKQYNDLNMTKIKKNKSRKQHGKRNSSPCNVEAKEVVGAEKEGAQYITLVMDPLFASQLNMLFGPVGDCEISGELTHEDRSVVLPLEICEKIHSYWTRTVDGKFLHEAEILDSLVRQDEILARKLQEEENAALNLNEKQDDVANDGLPEDQPVCFQEIMNLEQALQESLADRTHEDTSISSQLNLKRLYKEYPHVDPVALKEEYTRNSCKYPVTVASLNQRYGKEQGTPKTVIAPEALDRYEQEMIERAQQNSLEEQEQETSNLHTEIVPDDPQIYRDEAQTHYHQRQEAFRKAQEAFRQGMKAAAAYYAHIGNLHSEKLREANQRASQKILEAKNAHRKDANCLDLHLLHVPEAINATQAFLQERQRVLIARGIRQMEVSLVTGRGAHSAGGKAVLKPSIKEHLKKHGYSFYEANSGMLRVVLQSKTS